MDRAPAAQGVETLPYSWYVDSAVATAEREHIFRRSWQYAGHTGELDGPGSFFPTLVAGLPVVVVLDREEALRGYLNVCRHRGTILVEEPQARGTIQCPYHAWTYGLDGSLRGAPRSKERAGLRQGRARSRAGVRGHLGAVRVREPGPGRARAGRHARRPPGGGGRERPRRRRAALPPPHLLLDQRQLEDRDRELPRVLPLPAQPPGPDAGDRRGGPAPRVERPPAQPVPAGPPRRAQRQRALRHQRRGAHGAVPHPLPRDEVQRQPGPTEPVDRADVAHRGRPHRGLVRLLLRGRRGRDLDRPDARVRQPGRARRTRRSWRPCSAGPAAARCRTGAS